MSLFVSYSSRDRAGLEALLSALRRAHEEVWFDEELGAGEVWWRTILERIRDCEAFVFAMTASSLESKPCLAELRYAQELNKPIVPVQIGPVPSMRVTPLAEVEAIDYQNPSVDSGIRLITAVREAREHATALPSPLPEEPPVPFAYLMRLAATISGSTLDPHQQMALVSELRSGLEEDGHDDAARRDITQLLYALRDRPEVTYRTRTDIENLLATLGHAPAPQFMPTPPPPPAPMAYPVAPARTPSHAKWWIAAGVAGVAIVAVVVAVVVVALDKGRHGPNPTPAQPTSLPTVTPSTLKSVLLSAEEVTSIMRATDMTASQMYTTMGSGSITISDEVCMGSAYTAQSSVYSGSGWSAVSDQTLQQPRGDQTTNSAAWVDQTAVTFPSHDQARAFLEKSADQWKSCAGKTVTITVSGSDNSPTWTFGDLSRNGDVITQVATQEGASGWACEHTLTAYSNAVFEAIACSDQISDEATRITEKMVANANG